VDHRQEAFVESLAGLLTANGLPPMASRMWAWLLVCDPPQQRASQLAETLHASRGAISGAARVLETAGLVRRTTRRGDRHETFSVPPGSLVAILESRLPATTAFRRVADEGLALLADAPREQRARLQELRDVYAFMERELPALVERFRAQQQGHSNPAA
jgi:DNA-binding transcriptional regulator GbsR (MarR family)